MRSKRLGRPQLSARVAGVGLRLAFTLVAPLVCGALACSEGSVPAASDAGDTPLEGRCGDPVAARGTANVIDDFATADLRLPARDGRESSPWSAGPVAETTLDAASGALHFSTPTTEDWTSFSVQLVGSQGCYDASAYAGIRLKFKLGAPNGVGPAGFKFGIATPPSTPVENGGECSEIALCYDHFAVVMPAANFSSEYRELEVRWDEFFQGGWGWAAEPLYRVEKHALSLIFGGMEQGYAYDIWIDDIEFIERGDAR